MHPSTHGVTHKYSTAFGQGSRQRCSSTRADIQYNEAKFAPR